MDRWLTKPRSAGGYPITDAFRWFERYLSFASHDATNRLAAYGYVLLLSCSRRVHCSSLEPGAQR
jgi:hypothetical protein